MWFLKKNKTALLLLLVQAILCIIAFNKFWLNPADFMFMSIYDGAKNYYTFQAYLQQDSALGFGMLMQQGYPYGDYIFYTDMTPTIAVPLKLFCTYIYDVSAHGIPIFNFIIIFLHCISVLVVYKILKHFIQTPWILALLSISLTWSNPQFLRLQNGHFNLSITLFILLGLAMLIQIYKDHQANPERYFISHKKRLVALGILLYLAAFTHLYFLPILGLVIGFFTFFYLFQLKFKQQQSWTISLAPMLALGLVCVLSLVAVLGTIQLVDSYYDLRNIGNNAYGTTDWKMTISSLFTAPYFHGIKYLFSYNGPINYESNLYLGAFILYSLTMLLFLKLWKGSSTTPSLAKKAFTEHPILTPFLGVALVCLFVGMGDTYQIADQSYSFNNYFNPFFHLRKYVTQIEQFRCLGRFVWPAFWIFGLTMGCVADYYWREHQNKAIQLSFGLFVILAAVDAKDVVGFQNRIFPENEYHNSCKNIANTSLSTISTSQYQAILPIPYFNIGTEVWSLEIDGGGLYNQAMFTISLCTNLPLMSMQSSRIAVKNTQELFSIFLDKTPTPSLLKKLNDKPILVLYHKDFYKKIGSYKDFPIPGGEFAKNVVLSGAEFPQKYNLKKVTEDSTYIVYEWDVASLKKRVLASQPKSSKQPLTLISLQNSKNEATNISCGAENINEQTNMLLATNKLSEIGYLSLRSKEKVRSGQFGIKLPPQQHGFIYQINKTKAQQHIQVSVWRHKQSAEGAIYVQGRGYRIMQAQIIQDSLDWELVEAKIVLPPNFSPTPLTISYWNNSNSTVWLDDFKLICD